MLLNLGMNSTCRSIDLATNMIAPIAVGQVMYFLSHFVAAVTIASWNVLSFFIECFLLWRIYKEFPNLAVKTSACEKQPLQGILVYLTYQFQLKCILLYDFCFLVLESGEKESEPGDQPTADDANVKIGMD
jgi:iron-regulated transporter 1